MFVYQSKIGKRIIKKNSNNRFALIINEECYGNYHSPIAAADDVYLHVTGCYEWDILDGLIYDCPTSIYEWKRIR